MRSCEPGLPPAPSDPADHHDPARCAGLARRPSRSHSRILVRLGGNRARTRSHPDLTLVKLTITVLSDLHQVLRDYARFYAEIYDREEPV